MGPGGITGSLGKVGLRVRRGKGWITETVEWRGWIPRAEESSPVLETQALPRAVGDRELGERPGGKAGDVEVPVPGSCRGTGGGRTSQGFPGCGERWVQGSSGKAEPGSLGAQLWGSEEAF